MKHLRTILLCGLIGLAFASCVTSKKVNYLQEPTKHNKIPSYADTVDYEEYKLRTGDRLYIYVYSLDENIMRMYNAGTGSQSRSQMMQQMQYSGGRTTNELYSYLIDKEGNIDFPTIGKVQVAGLTTRETKRVMEEQLSSLLKEIPGYTTISVEVMVMQRTFSLIGVQSGRYPIDKEKMTIFEALALMGNLQTYSDRSRVKIVREINGETVIKTFDLRSKDIINSEFYYVQPNDIIYVRELTGKAFGITSAGAGVAVVSATLSFGVFVYTVVATGINHVKKYKK
ncbi:MAG: polysaccharide biosynthesis/export family protein [Paludibacteraceae bacterium]|nr:polysaccharide biosynthesis/export family protein [Paludibacteraceae bacterium]